MDSPSTHDTTIVVPVYNVEKYLPECLDSIIHQTYPHIDIILVDDGSTDSSGKICDDYAKLDPRISVIHKPNGGLSDARNAGLAQARTKYIYFLDSDDYIEPQAIEILRAVCEQNSLDMLKFDLKQQVDQCSNHIEHHDALLTKGQYPGVMTGAKLYISLKNNRDYQAPVQLYFYNREFLTRNSLTFKKGMLHEDELFTFVALLHAKRAMHISALLYNYRVRSDSLMQIPRTKRDADCMYEILREVLNKHDHFRDDPETREAYELGVMDIAGGYAANYAMAFMKQDKRGRAQFREMMSELKSRGYDVSRCELRIRFVWLYWLKLTIIRAIIRRPKLKNFLKSCWNNTKRLAKRFITRLDDESKAILARLNETNKPDTRRIITLCVPRYGNRGDIAISLAQRKMLTENFPGHVMIEIPGELCRDYPHLIIPNINTSDVLLINGGGFFGSFWRGGMLAGLNILRNFPNNKIVIMPQTVYYNDSKKGRSEIEQDRRAFSKFTDLHVFVRDRNSFDLIHRENLFPNAKSIEHVPDMVCSFMPPKVSKNA